MKKAKLLLSDTSHQRVHLSSIFHPISVNPLSSESARNRVSTVSRIELAKWTNNTHKPVCSDHPWILKMRFLLTCGRCSKYNHKIKCMASSGLIVFHCFPTHYSHTVNVNWLNKTFQDQFCFTKKFDLLLITVKLGYSKLSC